MPASYLLRRGGEISGPHPRGLLLRHLALGRVARTDEISVDGVEWVGIDQCSELAAEEGAVHGANAPHQDPEWIEERRKARLRWLDERAQPDRRGSAEAAPRDGRSGSDRRANPAAPRKLFGPSDMPAPRPFASLRVVLVVVILVALTGAALLWFVPQYVPRIRLLENPASKSSTKVADVSVRWRRL